jgi:SRSO17 transposase
MVESSVPLGRLMRVAFRRWNVEHSIRLSKSEIGFGHSEGRDYTGLMRHLLLCVLVMIFVAQQTERLRGTTRRSPWSRCRAANQRCSAALANQRGTTQ